MIGLFRLALLCVLIYLIFKLLKLVLLKFISSKAGGVHDQPGRPVDRQRVDKSQAQDAEFEEIKDK